MAEHIRIGDITPWEQTVQTVEGNTAFDYPFPIFAEADLEVFVDDAGPLTLGTDYTVTGAGADDGGTITMAAAPAVGATVTRRRRIAIQRTRDFQDSGVFRAKVLNDELDYQVAALQQVADDVARSLRLPATDPDSGLELPAAAARAGRVLGFDDEGRPQPSAMTLVAIEAGSGSAAASAVSAAASAAAATAAQGAASASATDAAASAASAAASAATLAMPPVTLADAGKAAVVKADGSGWEASAAPLGDAALAAIAAGGSGGLLRADGDGAALVGLPYDLAFNAGWGADMAGEDLEVRDYAVLVLSRDVAFTSGERGGLGVAAAGAAVIVDVRLNGTTLYATPPQFAAGATTLTAGSLSTTQASAGDVVSFAVTQKGSTTAGRKLTFTLPARTR